MLYFRDISDRCCISGKTSTTAVQEWRDHLDDIRHQWMTNHNSSAPPAGSVDLAGETTAVSSSSKVAELPALSDGPGVLGEKVEVKKRRVDNLFGRELKAGEKGDN